MNKKIIFSFLSVLILVSGLLVFTGCQEEEKEEVIKIGAIVPLSNSFYISKGTDTQRGLEMAVGEINSQGGINGKELRIVFEDNEGSSKKSISALNKLLLIDNPDIIYSLFTGPSRAITSIIKENNKLMIYQSTVPSIAREEKAYICDDYWNYEYLGNKIAEIAINENPTKIGLLRSQTEYGEIIEKSFVQKTEESNISLIIETYGLGDKDVKTQLSKFKHENINLIASEGFASNYLTLINNLDDLKYLEDTTLIVSPAMYEMEKKADEKIINSLNRMNKIITAYPKTKSEGIDLFLEKWHKYSDAYPSTEALYAYDDMHILAKALKYCDERNSINNECVYNYIKSNKFESVEGTVEVDENCIFKRNLMFLEYKNSEWVEYE